MNYTQPTQDQGRELMMRGIKGPVVMLNLIRLREVADYTATPDLAPDIPISGREAYDRYIEEARPHLEASGGRVEFLGDAGAFFIGPGDESWDIVMLVRQVSVDAFIAHAQNEALMEASGHRCAAIEDARLLPIVEVDHS